MYRCYTFSRRPMNNGTTIHTTAKSYIAYKFADRYLGISPTIHVALWLYELVFYTKSNQNLIVQTSTEHLLSAFTKKYIIFLKTWCYLMCACFLYHNDVQNSSFSVEHSILKETKRWSVWEQKGFFTKLSTRRKQVFSSHKSGKLFLKYPTSMQAYASILLAISSLLKNMHSMNVLLITRRSTTVYIKSPKRE